MAAYRRISARIFDCDHLRPHCETPANKPIRYRMGWEMGLIAMQKVVGSNPISRFYGVSRHRRQMSRDIVDTSAPSYRLGSRDSDRG